jgi:eukaryotic-like serine/threonine-protein kinase
MTTEEADAPQVAEMESLVARVADEFLDRQRRGERPTAAEYAARHPEAADLLRRVLTALEIAGLSGGPNAGDDGVATGTLGDFRLIREVGRGGMGIVYEAEQISLGRRVALKVLPFAATMDSRQLQRFHNEAKAAASLHHEHIVPVYAVGCERGVHYYAMQFITGATLAQVITGRAGDAESQVPVHAAETGPYKEADNLRSPAAPTSPIAALSTERTGPKGRTFYRSAAETVAHAADALEYAHAVGIVHRDIKPGNLLIDAAGKVWVADFGLARFGPDAGLTMSGDLLGTLRYMAPEQALARHGLADHRVDVYGLGCTLYELLTGRPAVGGTDKAEIVRHIAFEEPVAPRKLDKHIPAELETIALKCLAKNPNERYATAGELAADLRRFIEDKPIKAKPPSVRQRTGKWARRHAGAVWAVAAGLLLVALGTTASSVLLDRQKRHAQDAYARTRLALDEMSSKVIDEWLAKQPALSDEQKQFLERVLGHYEWLAEETGTDLETRVGLAAANLRVGDIRAKLGQTAEAETAYGRAIELYQKLADQTPNEPAYRLALGKGHRAHGGALSRLDRPAEAEASYNQALGIHEQLVAAAPADPSCRDMLADTLLEYGCFLGGGGEETPAGA